MDGIFSLISPSASLLLGHVIAIDLLYVDFYMLILQLTESVYHSSGFSGGILQGLLSI